MLETVVECLVKCRLSTKAIIQRSIMVAIDILVGLFTIVMTILYLPFVGFLFCIFAAVFTYLVFRNTKLEYEYSYFDNELVVDKIMNQKVRKRLHTYSFSKLEIMAPTGSQRLRLGVNNRKQFSYTSNDPEAVTYTAVLYDEKNRIVELKFEPNEELLTRLQHNHPRKIYLD